MGLFRRYLDKEAAALVRKRRAALRHRPARPASRATRADAIRTAERRAPPGGRPCDLRLAVDYSARDAILRAADRRRAVHARELRGTARGGDGPAREAPDVDLLIRTGGRAAASATFCSGSSPTQSSSSSCACGPTSTRPTWPTPSPLPEAAAPVRGLRAGPPEARRRSSNARALDPEAPFAPGLAASACPARWRCRLVSIRLFRHRASSAATRCSSIRSIPRTRTPASASTC